MTREQLLKAIFETIGATRGVKDAKEFKRVMYRDHPELSDVTPTELLSTLMIGDLFDIAEATEKQ